MEPWCHVRSAADFIRRFHGKKIEDFLVIFPEQKWDYRTLTRYVSLDFIATHIFLPWDTRILSDRPDLTWDFVMRVHGKFSFEWKILSRHPNISFQLIKEKSAFPWYPEFVLRNPSVSIEDAKDPFFKGVATKEFFMCSNPNIPMEFFTKDRTLRKYLDWDQLTLRAPREFILTNRKLPWDTCTLARRADIPIRSIIDLIEDQYSASIAPMHLHQQATILSRHPQISLTLIRELIKKDGKNRWSEGWDYTWLSRFVPFNEILENPDEPWDLGVISARDEVTLQIIKDNPSVKWKIEASVIVGNVRWEELTGHPRANYMSISPAVTWDVIQDNPHVSWNLRLFSVNCNLTADIVKKNPNVDWAWGMITKFTYLTSGPVIRFLVRLERKNRQKEVLAYLEKDKFLITDVNTVIASYIDYQ